MAWLPLRGFIVESDMIVVKTLEEREMETEEKFMKKKGVAIAIPTPSPSPSRSIDESEYEENMFPSAVLRFSTQNASSKYDFVKVLLSIPSPKSSSPPITHFLIHSYQNLSCCK
ncbi:hypothetical protein LguiA_006187 [Lonicera macranthoides]